MIRRFEQHTMLWVHRLRLSRCDREKRGIEIAGILLQKVASSKRDL